MLKEGDKAPPFDLESDEGGRVSLKDFDKGRLVLYFYPRDNTPGCTRQAQAFTQQKQKIEAAGAKVVGISRDSLKSHASFREKCGLGITLLSDPDLSVHKAYGAFGEKTMYGKKVEGVLRSTFVIDGGKVVRVFPNVKVDGHADAILKALSNPNDEESMAAKKKTSKGEDLGEKAGKLVAKAVGKVAEVLAPKKKKAGGSRKSDADEAAEGEALVERIAGGSKKKSGGAKKSAGAAKKKAGGATKKKTAAKKKAGGATKKKSKK